MHCGLYTCSDMRIYLLSIYYYSTLCVLLTMNSLTHIDCGTDFKCILEKYSALHVKAKLAHQHATCGFWVFGTNSHVAKIYLHICLQQQ